MSAPWLSLASKLRTPKAQNTLTHLDEVGWTDHQVFYPTQVLNLPQLDDCSRGKLLMLDLRVGLGSRGWDSVKVTMESHRHCKKREGVGHW